MDSNNMENIQLDEDEPETQLEAIHPRRERLPSDISDDNSLSADQEIHFKNAPHKSSIANASFNLTNSIIGAGIIGMPFAINEAGFGFGIILIIVMGIITDYSIMLLIKSGEKARKYTYQDLVEHCFGRKGYHALSFAQCFFPIFGMIAYTMIIGQTLPKLFDTALGVSFLSERNNVITAMTFTVMIPLSINKDIDSLSRWSAVALSSVVLLTCVVIFHGPFVEHPHRGDPINFISPGIVQAIGVMAFAYVCHHNSFLIFHSLQNPTIKRFSIVTHSSVGAAAVMSLILGIGGYLCFGDATKDNVLNNFTIRDAPANVARFFFAVSLMLTYPIECFVVRDVINNYFFPKQSVSNLRHYSLSVGICIVCLLMSLLVTNLGYVLELNGVVNANLIAFILPGLCGYVLAPGPWYSAERRKPLVLIIFGVALLIFGVILILREIAAENK